MFSWLFFRRPLMTSSGLRWSAGLAAIVAAAFLTPPTAEAANCSGKSCTSAKLKKASAQPRRTQRRVTARRTNPRVAVQTPRKWHGWGASFYLSGVRYEGGNPVGPAAWYNNWEGGFHPKVYWVLRDNQMN